MPAPPGLRVFATGGYSVWRGPLNGRQGLLVFDHGPLGYLAIAAHGHADALAVWLHLDDCPVLVDAGTYLYHSGADWRQHFRSTAAHNTITVEGRSSSTTAGNFNWSRRANGGLVESAEGDTVIIAGEHDGYVERFACRHRRTLTIASGRIALADRLDGAEEREAEIAFHVHPDLDVTEGAGGFLVSANGARLLQIEGPPGFAPQRTVATPLPGLGWYSPHFGVKVPLTRLSFVGRLGAGRVANTVIDVVPAAVTARGDVNV